jgi:hypothetical protein
VDRPASTSSVPRSVAQQYVHGPFAYSFCPSIAFPIYEKQNSKSIAFSNIVRAVDPTCDGEDFTQETVQAWININSFSARCMGAGITGPYDLVIYALRDAFEENLAIEEEFQKAECKIRVACEWLTHSAVPLLWWARENIGLVEVAEDSTQWFPGGPLYQGPPCVCLRRWGFWQSQLQDLGKNSALSEEVRKAAFEAAGTMTAVERRTATTL